MIGVFVSMKAYEVLMEEKNLPVEDFPIDERRKELLEIFDEKKVMEFLKTYEGKRLQRVDLEKIRKALEDIYSEFLPLLKKALETIDVTSMIRKYRREFLSKIVRLSNTIRDRFTILDVFDEMKLLKSFSREIF
ncbi:MAG: glycerol-phosphate dehydrogenase [Thermotoga sp.]|nr:glycerol-phosphate dehydrogenase [Thermotoga sp.]